MGEGTDVEGMARDLRVLNGKLRRRMRAGAEEGDYTPSQINALARLESDGPMTVTALAAAEGVRPQTMGATIAALEAAGLVGGTPDPADGRRTILALTADARASFAELRSVKENWLVRAIRTHLSEAEQQTLATAIDLLERLADAP